jgi:hypothetical protein
MLPKYHLFFGTIFVGLIYLFFPQTSLYSLIIILLVNFFIDGDHLIYYFSKKKDLNLFKAYEWYKQEKSKILSLTREKRKRLYSGFYFLHGIEIVLIFLILGLFLDNLFIFIFLGSLIHFIVDVIYEFYFKGTIHKSSLIYSYIIMKKLKN